MGGQLESQIGMSIGKLLTQEVVSSLTPEVTKHCSDICRPVEGITSVERAARKCQKTEPGLCGPLLVPTHPDEGETK